MENVRVDKGTAGNHSSDSDPLVQVRHDRPGAASGTPDGCSHSLYMHLSGLEVASGAKVKKGQLLGYSGATDTGYAHPHFEVRDALPRDPYSR